MEGKPPQQAPRAYGARTPFIPPARHAFTCTAGTTCTNSKVGRQSRGCGGCAFRLGWFVWFEPHTPALKRGTGTLSYASRAPVQSCLKNMPSHFGRAFRVCWLTDGGLRFTDGGWVVADGDRRPTLYSTIQGNPGCEFAYFHLPIPQIFSLPFCLLCWDGPTCPFFS
jgi:hypothetical protein